MPDSGYSSKMPLRHRLSLAAAALLAIAIMGVGVYFVVKVSVSPDRKALTQPLATMVTGMGVLIAGGLTLLNGHLQRRVDREKLDHDRTVADSIRSRENAQDLRGRYTAAAAQLGDTDHPTIRQAGVYALAGLADDWLALGNITQHQECVDLLASYIRSPNHVFDAQPARKPGRCAGPDGPVRAAILRVLAAHSDPVGDTPAWALSGLLHGADLRGISARDLKVSGMDLSRVDLSWADLSGLTANQSRFDGTFFAHAYMRSARFTDASMGYIEASHADFTFSAFTDTRVSGILDQAALVSADLDGARLGGDISLVGANFALACVSKKTSLPPALAAAHNIDHILDLAAALDDNEDSDHHLDGVDTPIVAQLRRLREAAVLSTARYGHDVPDAIRLLPLRTIANAYWSDETLAEADARRAEDDPAFAGLLAGWSKPAPRSDT